MTTIMALLAAFGIYLIPNLGAAQRPDEWFDQRRRPKSLDPPEEGVILLMPPGSQPQRWPAIIEPATRPKNLITRAKALEIERQLKEHEDFALEALAGFQGLAKKASVLQVYWENRLQDLSRRLKRLNAQMDTGVSYSRALKEWEDEVKRSENYADDADTLRDRMTGFARRIEIRHLPNIRTALKMVESEKEEGRLSAIEKALELSRAHYEAVIEIIRLSKPEEKDLSDLKTIAAQDQEKKQ